MTDWVTSMLEPGGYLMVAALMFLENLFPPIPSEVVMPLAGYAAQRGKLDIFLVTLAGSVGSLAGACFWYAVGRWLGCDRLKRFAAKHGRWLTLTPQEVDQADRWFDRHGGKAVFFGRLVPGVRTLISVPAGISDMSFRRFLAYTTAGTLVWTALLAAGGWFLGRNHEQLAAWMSPVSNVIVGAILLWYLYRVATFGRSRRKYEAERQER